MPQNVISLSYDAQNLSIPSKKTHHSPSPFAKKDILTHFKYSMGVWELFHLAASENFHVLGKRQKGE